VGGFSLSAWRNRPDVIMGRLQTRRRGLGGRWGNVSTVRKGLYSQSNGWKASTLVIGVQIVDCRKCP